MKKKWKAYEMEVSYKLWYLFLKEEEELIYLFNIILLYLLNK